MDKIKVKKSFLNRLNNTEHDYLHRNCSLTLREKADGLFAIEPLVARYLELYQQEDEVFKLSRGSELTPRLRALDRLRDKYVVDLRQSVRLLIRKAAEPMRTMAKKVVFVLNCYRRAERKAYAESTDLVINLLQDLSEDPYPDLIATLGLVDDVERLRVANEAFHDLYLERSMESLEKSALMPMRVARELCDGALLGLVSAINSCYEAVALSGAYPDDAARLGEIVHEIAAFVGQCEWVYGRRFSSDGRVLIGEAEGESVAAEGSAATGGS